MIFLFYFFSSLLLLSALGVIVSKNSIYSVFWLIFCILNTSGLFILLEAEFIAMSIIIIYAGAISVLFLFIIMMLDTDLIKHKKEKYHKYPIIIFITIFLIIDLFVVIFTSIKKVNMHQVQYILPNSDVQTNTHSIGDVLYTNFILPFEITGIILLITTIGCVIIISYKLKNRKKQNKQIYTTGTVRLVKIKNKILS